MTLIRGRAEVAEAEWPGQAYWLSELFTEVAP